MIERKRGEERNSSVTVFIIFYYKIELHYSCQILMIVENHMQFWLSLYDRYYMFAPT